MRPFLTATWQHLVMLNFAADPAVLEPLVPRGVVLDDFDGQHFVSIVGFQFLNTKVRGIPALCYSNFDEVNLRFYVRREVGSEVRRGVVFVKEAVPFPIVAWVANRIYHEHYVSAQMSLSMAMSIKPHAGHASMQYGWKHGGRWHTIGASTSCEPTLPDPGSLTSFITEHYWGYTKRRDGRTSEYKVEHPPWRVWPAERSEYDIDAAGFYGPAFAKMLSEPPVSAFVAEGSPVAVFRSEIVR